MSSRKPQPSRVSSPLPPIVLACLALAVVALITSGWAIWLFNQNSDLQNDLDSTQRELATVRENANATLYPMEATDVAPENVRGQAWVSLRGSGVVSVSNMPKPGDNEAFQIWLILNDDSTVSAGTFTVDANGQGFALLPADVQGVVQIAVSIEPAGGSAQPTGQFLLTADVQSGRG